MVKHNHPAVEVRVEPQVFYSQTELRALYLDVRGDHPRKKTYKSTWQVDKQLDSSYEKDLDRRIRKLDQDTQRRLEKLVERRTSANSSDTYRREYKVVALAEVPGGRSITGIEGYKGTRLWYRPWARKRPAKMEYRLILEGVETKRTENDCMWVCNMERMRSEFWDGLDFKKDDP